MKLKKTSWAWLAGGIILALTGCDAQQSAMHVSAAHEPSANVQPVTSDIINGKGKKIGTATFTQLAKGVQIDVSASGLKKGLHGIHIHEMGKCEAPDFKSAGGHFNPTSKEHGFNNPNGEHAGDLANLVVGSNGKGEVQFVNTAVTLRKGEPNSLFKEGGTSLVIHADPDDMHTNPAGNSGDRIGCAVIR
ncbi:superoxide dismutase family protein [Paenibacillus sp. GCM10027629]|uniref:superoxide dismutase family protein n=1 Tax=Paenibacillus TaxID=44249 RepID=UPI00036128F3